MHTHASCGAWGVGLAHVFQCVKFVMQARKGPATERKRFSEERRKGGCRVEPGQSGASGKDDSALGGLKRGT